MNEPIHIKDRIREKAKELFMQLGVRSVSMDDIASSIGISKKTLYQHYKDKESVVSDAIELVLQISKTNCEKCKKSAENAIHEGFLATQSVTELLKNLNPVLLYDTKKYTPKAYKKFEQFKEQFLYSVLYENIEWGIRDGLFRNDININLVTRLRIETIDLPFQKHFSEQIKTNSGTLQNELLLLFLYSIATPQGAQIINDYKTKTT